MGKILVEKRGEKRRQGQRQGRDMGVETGGCYGNGNRGRGANLISKGRRHVDFFFHFF